MSIKNNKNKDIQNFDSYVKKKYKGTPYYKRKYIKEYLGHLIFSIVLVSAVIGFIVYLQIKKEIAELRNRWGEIRCKPPYIAMAHIITPQKGKSSNDILTENMQHCATDVAKSVAEQSTAGIKAGMNSTKRIYSGAADAVNSIRRFIDEIRDLIISVINSFIEKIKAGIIPIYFFIIKLKELLHKISGVLTAMFHVVLTMYYSLRNMIVVVTTFLFTIIIITIILLWFLIALSIWNWYFLIITIPLGILVIFVLVNAAIVHGELYPVIEKAKRDDKDKQPAETPGDPPTK